MPMVSPDCAGQLKPNLRYLEVVWLETGESVWLFSMLCGFQVKSDGQGVFKRHISGRCEGQVCASSARRHGFRHWEWSVGSYGVLSKCKDANLITDSRQFCGFASFCSATRQRQLKWLVFHCVCVTYLSPFFCWLEGWLSLYTVSSVCVISLKYFTSSLPIQVITEYKVEFPVLAACPCCLSILYIVMCMCAYDWTTFCIPETDTACKSATLQYKIKVKLKKIQDTVHFKIVFSCTIL